jgi:hypothetical protein
MQGSSVALIVEWQLDVQRCADAPGALERDRAADRLGAIFQAQQSGAAGGIGAADAAVPDGDAEDALRGFDGNVDDRRTRVLGRLRAARSRASYSPI